MKGIEILQKKCKELNIEFSDVNLEKGELNGDVILTHQDGFKIKTNIKKLSEIYGVLTFFHFEPNVAINEMLDILINDNLYNEWVDYFTNKFGLNPFDKTNGVDNLTEAISLKNDIALKEDKILQEKLEIITFDEYKKSRGF
jgi:hypothetical protein